MSVALRSTPLASARPAAYRSSADSYCCSAIALLPARSSFSASGSSGKLTAVLTPDRHVRDVNCDE